jgi:hypothetical protein
LKVKNAEASVSGAGNAYLDVSNDLKADISGAGNLKYSGEPEIQKYLKVVQQIFHQRNLMKLILLLLMMMRISLKLKLVQWVFRLSKEMIQQ